MTVSENLKYSLNSGNEFFFFSLTRFLTVCKFLCNYADTTSVLFCGDFGKLKINIETVLCFIVQFEKLFVKCPFHPNSTCFCLFLNVFIRILVCFLILSFFPFSSCCRLLCCRFHNASGLYHLVPLFFAFICPLIPFLFSFFTFNPFLLLTFPYSFCCRKWHGQGMECVHVFKIILCSVNICSLEASDAGVPSGEKSHVTRSIFNEKLRSTLRLNYTGL